MNILDVIDLQNRNFANNFKEVIGKTVIIDLEVLCPNYKAELYSKEDLANCKLFKKISVELFCTEDIKFKLFINYFEIAY